MAVNEIRKLNGLVEGKRIYFEVEVAICSNLNVLDLRRLARDLRKEEWRADIKILVLLTVYFDKRSKTLKLTTDVLSD